MALTKNEATNKNGRECDLLQIEVSVTSHTHNEWRVFLTPTLTWGFPTRIPDKIGGTVNNLCLWHPVSCSLFPSLGCLRLGFSFEVSSGLAKNTECDRILTWVKRVGKFQSMEFVAIWGHPCCFHVFMQSPCPHLRLAIAIKVQVPTFYNLYTWPGRKVHFHRQCMRHSYHVQHACNCYLCR